jgi:DUF1680 family protein
MWNHRMFLLHGEAKYFDVLERVIYNGFLSGVAFSGDLFFYPNPLACDGQTPFNMGGLGREPWFRTSCCPTNVVRFLPSLLGYIYAQREAEIYVNLYISGQAIIQVDQTPIRIAQQTNYPWDGQIRLTIDPEAPVDLTLRLRIPGWVQGQPVPSDLYQYLNDQPEVVGLKVNGKTTPVEGENGFATIRRTWQPGDVIELDLPMPIRRVISHSQVEENVGRVALERGPIVYCLEAVDHNGSVSNIVLPDDAQLTTEHRADLLNGVTVLRNKDDASLAQSITAIPYYAWAHRGPGEMTVWLQRQDN